MASEAQLTKIDPDTTMKGFWWLPDVPETRLSGEIVYGSCSGAKLSLLDHFFKVQHNQPFTVWGVTAWGVPITLFECYTEKLTAPLKGTPVANVFSYFGVVGGHFKTRTEIRFTKVFAEVDYLQIWARRTGIKFGHPIEPQVDGWRVTQEMLPDVLLGESNGLKVALQFTGGVSFPHYGQCHLEEECALTLIAEVPTKFDVFETTILKIQHFITLLVGKPVYARTIKGSSNAPIQAQEAPRFEHEYHIIRRLSIRADLEENMIRRSIRFSLDDLKPEPSFFIGNFFKKQQLLELACNLYLSTIYNPEMFPEQRFLTLTQAVEAYHRAFIGGKYQSDDVYQDGLQKLLWQAIPETVEPSFRMSLKNKLKYLHEYSLRKRILDLCDKFDSVIRPYLGNGFADIVTNQRNLKTHSDSTTNSRAPLDLDWVALWLKSEQLSLLLEVCLLSEIGFTLEQISKSLPRNQRAVRILLNLK